MTDQTLPTITRMRHELVRRSLTVAATERLTPHMQRITLTGPDLAGFQSAGFDDHIKLMVGGEARRDYTPRRFDAGRGELVVDFALHDAGPATLWALNAVVGDAVMIGGPRGSVVIGGAIGQWLMVGDETALPAIGRRIEDGGTVRAVVAVPGPADEQDLPGVTWVHRDAALAGDAGPLLTAVRGLDVAPGTFVWIAAEASVARALRAHFLATVGVPMGWIKASGHWVQGQADTTEKF